MLAVIASTGSGLLAGPAQAPPKQPRGRSARSGSLRCARKDGRRKHRSSRPAPSSDLASRGHLLPQVGEGARAPALKNPFIAWLRLALGLARVKDETSGAGGGSVEVGPARLQPLKCPCRASPTWMPSLTRASPRAQWPPSDKWVGRQTSLPAGRADPDHLLASCPASCRASTPPRCGLIGADGHRVPAWMAGTADDARMRTAALLLPLAGEGGPCVSKGRMRAVPKSQQCKTLTKPHHRSPRPAPSSDLASRGHLLPLPWEKERASARKTPFIAWPRLALGLTRVKDETSGAGAATPRP